MERLWLRVKNIDFGYHEIKAAGKERHREKQHRTSSKRVSAYRGLSPQTAKGRLGDFQPSRRDEACLPVR